MTMRAAAAGSAIYTGMGNAKPNVTRRLLLRVLAYAKPYRRQNRRHVGDHRADDGPGLAQPADFP